MQISLDRVHRIFHFPDLTTHPVFQCYDPRRVVCAKSLSDIYSAVGAMFLKFMSFPERIEVV